jgi:hypothetical protein
VIVIIPSLVRGFGAPGYVRRLALFSAPHWLRAVHTDFKTMRRQFLCHSILAGVLSMSSAYDGGEQLYRFAAFDKPVGSGFVPHGLSFLISHLNNSSSIRRASDWLTYNFPPLLNPLFTSNRLNLLICPSPPVNRL